MFIDHRYNLSEKKKEVEMEIKISVFYDWWKFTLSI